MCDLRDQSGFRGLHRPAQLDGQSQISLTCTTGTTWNVGLNAGNFPGATVTTRRMSGPGNSSLLYSLYQNPARTAQLGQHDRLRYRVAASEPRRRSDTPRVRPRAGYPTARRTGWLCGYNYWRDYLLERAVKSDRRAEHRHQIDERLDYPQKLFHQWDAVSARLVHTTESASFDRTKQASNDRACLRLQRSE